MNNGRLRTIITNDPGPGGDFSQTVPAGEIWQFLAMNFVLSTSSSIGTRLVFINFGNGTRTTLQTSGITQPESRSLQYNVASLGSAGPVGYIPVPPVWILYPGYTIVSGIAARLSGDNFSSAIITYLQS